MEMGFAVAWLCKDSDHNKLTHFKDKIKIDRIEDLVNDDMGSGCYGFLQKQKRRMVLPRDAWQVSVYPAGLVCRAADH